MGKQYFLGLEAIFGGSGAYPSPYSYEHVSCVIIRRCLDACIYGCIMLSVLLVVAIVSYWPKSHLRTNDKKTIDRPLSIRGDTLMMCI